jgi:hypothetical protein
VAAPVAPASVVDAVAVSSVCPVSPVLLSVSVSDVANGSVTWVMVSSSSSSKAPPNHARARTPAMSAATPRAMRTLRRLMESLRSWRAICWFFSVRFAFWRSRFCVPTSAGGYLRGSPARRRRLARALRMRRSPGPRIPANAMRAPPQA